MKRLLLGLILLIGVGGAAQVTAPSGDVLGAHNLSAATSPVNGPNANACLYCHAPHSGLGKGPLWTQTFSSQTYSTYTSDTLQNKTAQPEIGKDSTLCLSCHDGTVAPGQTTPSGEIKLQGTMTSIVGTKLESSHPFSLQLPLQDSSHLVASLKLSQTTADLTGSVKLIKGNVECTSCHNAHIQGIDPAAPYFLAKENKGGALCLSCHETKARTVNGHENPLQLWPQSVHAMSIAQVGTAAKMGGYTSVAEFACISCHVPHNAGGAAGLLRQPPTALTGVDTTSQSCFTCHDGSKSMVSPIANVLAEFQKSGHPYANEANLHSTTEPVVLNQNRHTTCADCHNSHSSQDVKIFGTPPDLRPSQIGTAGVGTDGTPITTGATKQYETCLRCHGKSAGKQSLIAFGYLPRRAVDAGDPYNVISQFDTSSVSAHPVMHDRMVRAQPSLLPAMWDLLGKLQMRPMGVRIFCTDCHNSDDNREFGGIGPNGPHGSANTHILERPYIASEVVPGQWPDAGPGTLVKNLNPMVAPYPQLDPGSGGPYSMCAKCHNLQNIMTNVSFVKHSKHVEKGFSCSVCHSAHGVPAGSAGLSGRGYINFDVNVVAPNAGVLSYSNQTCTLTCHMMNHNPDGTVTPVSVTPTTPTAAPAPVTTITP